jgi:hypothetical protein
VLTGITKQTDTDKLPETSSQVAIMDLVMEGLPYHAYRIDFEPAFQTMFKKNEPAKLKYLYLNSAISSSEQAARLAAFKRACAACSTAQELRVISVNQESGDADKLESVLASYKPDIVCGYVHHSWLPMITSTNAKVYPYALDSSRASFAVNSSEWMQSVLSDLYANLEERRPETKILSFPATFRP